MTYLPNWVYRLVDKTSPDALALDREALVQVLGLKDVLSDGNSIAFGIDGPGPGIDPVRLWGHFFELSDDGIGLFRTGISPLPGAWFEWPFIDLPEDATAQLFAVPGPEVPLPHGRFIEEMMCRDCGFPMKTSDPRYKEWTAKFERQLRSLAHVAGLSMGNDLVGRKLRVSGPGDEDAPADPDNIVIRVDRDGVIETVRNG